MLTRKCQTKNPAKSTTEELLSIPPAGANSWRLILRPMRNNALAYTERLDDILPRFEIEVEDGLFLVPAALHVLSRFPLTRNIYVPLANYSVMMGDRVPYAV